MISVSDEFRTTMQQPSKEIRLSVATSESTPQIFSSSDVLASLDITATGNYFSTAAKILTMKLIGTNYDLVGVEITPTLEAKIMGFDDVWHPCPYGRFKVTEQEVDLEKGTTIFKAQDLISEIVDTKYLEGDLAWGCSIKSITEQIAEKLHVDLMTDMTTLPNADYIIAEDLYAKISNTNYRNILAELAGATASLCRLHDNRIEFVAPKIDSSDETLTYANLLKVKLSPIHGPINSVVLARTPQEDNIAVKDDESIEINGLTELKLANNEILDDDREILAKPILDVVNGFSYYPCEAVTEGHGWYEIGDILTLTDGENEWNTVVTDIKLSFSGGIKETLSCATPSTTQTDYSCAGGITQKIYNTEIKVDKQNQEIKSVVSEFEELENMTKDNFTQITQNVTEVVTSIQNSGGNNLIRNSAMYFKEQDGSPSYWSLSSNGVIKIMSSAEASSYGSLSGQAIQLLGKTITQAISVKADDDSVADDDKTYYTFSCRIRKVPAGDGYIRLTDGHSEWKIDFPNGFSSVYKEFSIENILPTSASLVLEVYGSSDSELCVTDMMLAVGNYRSQWTQANGELANTQTQVNIQGVKVQSSTADVSSQLTPQGIQTKSGSSTVSSLTNDGLTAPKITAKTGIDMPPIKIVPQTDGWAFVLTQ